MFLTGCRRIPLSNPMRKFSSMNSEWTESLHLSITMKLIFTFATIRFNDSVSVTYHIEDTFAKSTLLKSCWEITKQHKTRGSSTHEVLYTIDDQDYQNALIQLDY